MYDVIIVGSGPAGVFSAYGLKELKVLIIDVGFDNCFELNNSESFDISENYSANFKKYIGNDYNSLKRIFNPEINIKLKSPYFQYITHNTKELCPSEEKGINTVISFAKGGLMNAWGGVIYRYDDKDLTEFPFDYEEIRPYYDKVELISQKIKNSINESHINPLFNALINNYNKHISYFNKIGIKIDKLEILNYNNKCSNNINNVSKNYNNYYHNQDSLYSVNFTLLSLIEKKEIIYKNNLLVTNFIETNNSVIIYANDIMTGKTEIFSSKKLILAAGCINSSKIILNSYNDYSSRLPFKINETSYTPFIIPSFIGKSYKNRYASLSHGLLYNLNDCHKTICTSFHAIDNISISDWIMEIPLTIINSLNISKLLVPSILIAQVFYPSVISDKNWIKIDCNKKIHINYEMENKLKFENILIKSLRKIGLISHIKLSKKQVPGSSFHYACSLPMKKNPGKYQTYKSGLLFNSKNVYIADAANFSYLPSKNLTFTIMANALRIADGIKNQFIKNN